MKYLLWISCVLISTIGMCQQQTERIDLSGEWLCFLDRQDLNTGNKWASQNFPFKVNLPGSLTSNGIGDEIGLTTPWTGQIVDSSFFISESYSKYRIPGNFKIPFWLQPELYYKGAAMFQKEILVPPSWKGKPVFLFLERCHWYSTVWIDQVNVGTQNSLGTPHLYELTAFVKPGKHTITICIDNRIKEIDPGYNSHSISDHTQTNWNGIIGNIYLEARPKIHFSQLQVFPEANQGLANLICSIRNETGQDLKTTVEINVTFDGRNVAKTSAVYTLKKHDNKIPLTLKLGEELHKWNEYHTGKYWVEAIVTNPKTGEKDSSQTSFGLRDFSLEKGRLTNNGIPVFLRGTLECSIFPKTGYPPTQIDEWIRIFRICKDFGLNHMRFHSWCPPEAAFEAADQMGFYLQVECSSWANSSTSIGDGKPIDTFIYDESKRMIGFYGNHPSFCMLAYGNEPAGINQNAFLGELLSYWKETDNRRIYTSAGGWPVIPQSDYLNIPDPRIQGWGEGLNSKINSQPPCTDFDWRDKISMYDRPVVSHEIGQWCAYPDFKEIDRYDGVLKARNFEIFRESLKEQGMESLADSFLLASGKLQALCYKADIEAALRTPGFGGFQLLDLHDFPGQGTALVGLLNSMWELKGYIQPEDFRRFCNTTVPLVRLPKLIYKNNETLKATVEVCHFGVEPIRSCKAEWTLTGRSGIIATGRLPVTDIPIGNGFQLGEIACQFDGIISPEKLTLQVNVDGFVNQWNLWVYPSTSSLKQSDEKITIVSAFNNEVYRLLQQGGKVLLTLEKGSLDNKLNKGIKLGFSSIFWNTSWTKGQAPHTLGILCNPEHPAFREFPTDYHSDWQWWDACTHGDVIDLGELGLDTRPIVRVIDDWFSNRPLSLVFEARVGKGSIIVSSIDLLKDQSKRPEAIQLMHSLLSYMKSDDFHPVSEITPAQLQQLSH